MTETYMTNLEFLINLVHQPWQSISDARVKVLDVIDKSMIENVFTAEVLAEVKGNANRLYNLKFKKEYFDLKNIEFMVNKRENWKSKNLAIGKFYYMLMNALEK